MSDARFMQLALAEAQAAAAAGEVPVGAVVVKDGVVIARGRNAPVSQHDPSAHAEIAALRAAAAALGNYRLDGCELFVTLEPCAMCAGAMLHARVARVVFGAADPKTGAAGSVIDLFAQSQLNHQTRVEGGLLAQECAVPLQQFFRERRQAARDSAEPLRDDALRTPESRFAALPDALPPQCWLADLPAQQGWRMHYLDRGPADATMACIALHDFNQWGHLFRHLVAALPEARLLVPDLIGFGRSDKPKREAVHTLDWHATVLCEWLARLNVRHAVLVHAAGAEPLARALHEALPAGIVATFAAALHAEPGAAAAWQAPFPDRGFEAGPRALGHRRAMPLDLAPQAAEALARRVREAMGYSAP